MWDTRPTQKTLSGPQGAHGAQHAFRHSIYMYMVCTYQLQAPCVATLVVQVLESLWKVLTDSRCVHDHDG